MMTDYRTGEALIANLLQSVTGFDNGNVTRGKWGILNSGVSDHYAIIKPGPSGRRTFITPSTVNEPWSTIVQVWVRYVDDGTTLETLESAAAAILDTVDRYPRLDDASGYVVDSCAVSIGEALEMWRKSGGPAWLRQDIVIEWTGQREISFS